MQPSEKNIPSQNQASLMAAYLRLDPHDRHVAREIDPISIEFVNLRAQLAYVMSQINIMDWGGRVRK